MLNENLVKLRKAQGLTQEALAIKLNVVRQTISKWENGTAVPDADTLTKIASALDVSVSTLLGETNEIEKDVIASSLTQINEQIAIKNRRTSNVIKALFFVSLVIIGVLIGKVYFSPKQSEVVENLPYKVEITGVKIEKYGNDLVVSYVPSIDNKDLKYLVTFYSNDPIVANRIAKSEIKNGVYSSNVSLSLIEKNISYTIIINIEYFDEVRSVTIAENFSTDGEGFSYETR